MNIHFWALSLALAVGCGGSANKPSDGGADSVFIALESDFAPFQTWTRIFVGDGPLDGHPAGPRYGYLREKAPPGATKYPVGAIVVKTVEQGATREDWDVFAMVKRGGGFNQSGALDWEFFTLKINERGIPVLLYRGTNPDDGTADGGDTHGYGSAPSGVTCNRCHGILGTERSDHILSPALAPGAQ
jgi:hypothetical protein